MDFVNRYMVFPSQDYAFVGALYCAATHLWPFFDCFPYLHITSHTKRSGKTRYSELLGFQVANPFNVTGATAYTIFKSIKDDMPTIIMDEIESLGRETADTMRQVLNSGYRKGQTIPRGGKGGVIEQWPTFCPKIFIGIGDMNDTLRDRNIVVRLIRGEPKDRFVRTFAEADGQELRDEMHKVMRDGKDEILNAYQSSSGLPFLTDRDEEIWMPMFAICQVIMPEAVEDLKRIAVDMATEKTAVAKRHIDLKGSEEEAQDEEYSVKLLRDLHTAFQTTKAKHLTSVDAMALLRANPVAPWRKFRGDDGLSVIDMANLLSRFGIAPRNIKIAKGKVNRGYKRDDVMAAIAKL